MIAAVASSLYSSQWFRNIFLNCFFFFQRFRNMFLNGLEIYSQWFRNIFFFQALNMIAAAVASSLLWKFQTPLRQTATHLFVLLTDGAYI